VPARFRRRAAGVIGSPVALMSDLNLILLGPPGAGKGTQAERLTSDFDLPYLSTGNLLRQAVEDGSELGKKAESYMNAGELVPDEIIVGVVLATLEAPEAEDGFLFDGFPRNLEQADALEKKLEELGRKLTAVLLIEVPDDELVIRLAGRRQCAKAGHPYHVVTNKPKHEGVCDIDGSRLIQREDDKEETVRNRLEVYRRQTSPLVEYYEERGLLRRFDGTRSPTEVHDHIRATVATLRLEDEL
jgi:adenylate kinase